MPYVKTQDGTDLYVKDWGSGRPVVLIHGWPLNADSWEPQAIALAEAGYRAIAYDRRGFGRSGQPWGGHDYDTYADDLKAVLEAAGATEGVALVGFSMGGGEIARYMSRHGGAGVTHAALIGSVVPGIVQSDANPHGVPEAQLAEIAGQITKDRAKFFQGFFRDFYGVGLVSHPVSDAFLQDSWNVAMQASLHATLEAAKAWGFTDFTPDLTAFQVPTLIIHGTGDATVPIQATAHRAVDGIARNQLVEYAGAPHGLFATESDRLTKDLLTFLGG
ncbi:alpha/beta fold hydrolase [Sphingomonas yantingensis]|uniref:Pimeloyl-ACP methyl ester carboxylesterase n=1 Tax=Sphingomonas yantingensis TaxID=1241761 RepID=A0A7W9EI01_9SPHN|nr:alpha/beta hydrolase [Sphingomonas yantingensis]MBB5698667.1 pimeloyl-ACP methyl ester carboxylesterase [Sphingomonas yantingensis]